MTDQSADLHRGYRRAFILEIGCFATFPVYEIVFQLGRKDLFTGPGALPRISLEPSYAYFILAALALVVVLLIGPVTKALLAAKSDRRGAPASTAQKLAGVAIAVCVMTEAPAAAGFFLALLTRQAIYLHLSVFLCLGLTLAFYPRFSQWEEWARRP